LRREVELEGVVAEQVSVMTQPPGEGFDTEAIGDPGWPLYGTVWRRWACVDGLRSVPMASAGAQMCMSLRFEYMAPAAPPHERFHPVTFSGGP
jgi:hypothetical protein